MFFQNPVSFYSSFVVSFDQFTISEKMHESEKK